MSHPTFKQYLEEGFALDDVVSGKALKGPVTKYPKTNLKRFMDEWNENLGKWVASGHKKGYVIKKRVNAGVDTPVVLDMIDDDKLVSTAVISGHDDLKSGNYTFDFYNQESVHGSNKYRVIPGETSYESGWRWEMMGGDNLHHSDQRNMFTSDKDGRTMANSRQKDGDETPSWARPLRRRSKK